MNLLTQIKHKTQKGEEVIMDIGAKASNVLPENFVEQKERSNLTYKDKLPVIFGKLSKWYADLRPVAWSGSYSDLTNKPTIPEGSAANYQVANNDTTEAEGFVADARIVRTHGLEIDGLSRDLNAINDNGAIKGMDAREDGVYITYVPSSGADSVTKKLGNEPQLLGTLTGNGTFDCKKIANYKQLTKDNFFIIPKTVRARFNAPGGTDSSNMGWNSTKELKSIEYNADTGILSFYLTTSDSYSYGSYWTKSYSIDITGDLYCVF